MKRSWIIPLFIIVFWIFSIAGCGEKGAPSDFQKADRAVDNKEYYLEDADAPECYVKMYDEIQTREKTWREYSL